MMTNNRIRKTLWARALTAAVALNLLVTGVGAPAALAGAVTRTGGSVAVGAVTGIGDGTTAITQTSALGGFNWNPFGIGSSETVNFSNGGGLTVNRVTGSDGSDLLGALTADGAVWVLNPNGVLLGQNASINAGAFLAGAGDIDITGLSSGDAADLATLTARPLTLSGNLTVESGADFSGGNVGLFGASLTLPDVLAAGSLAIGQGSSVLLGTAAGGATTAPPTSPARSTSPAPPSRPPAI